MHHTRPGTLLRRYIPTASIFALRPQDNFNIFDMVAEDPISSFITLAILGLIIIAFIAFLTHRAILVRRREYRSRRERLALEMREELVQPDYSTMSSSSSAEERPWDESGSESSWGELETCENGVRVQAKRVQMRPGVPYVGGRVNVEEYEDSDGEGFQFVPCYLAWV